MTFVDANVFVYAVGGEHPLRAEAHRFLTRCAERGEPLATSAGVLQELLHVYLSVGRAATLDKALALVDRTVGTVWPVEAEDVRLARVLAYRHPGLSARDLVHLATCRRREISQIKTFDRALATAMGSRR